MIQEHNPLLGPDAKADCQVMLRQPNDGTNCHTSVPSPLTISTSIRLVKWRLDDALPVGSTGNAAHRLCASGSKHPDERFDALWSIQRCGVMHDNSMYL